MLPCPVCHNQLSRIRKPHGFAYSCAYCGGMSVTLPVLREDSSKDFVKGLLVSARQNGNVSVRRCPFCGRPMRTCQLSTPGGPLELDYCKLCNQV